MQNFFISLTLIAIALFLILLVLVQRGRGGGLAGALGGMGGQSAFGAKAGDTFTKITMWTAFVWIVFCIVSVRILTGGGDPGEVDASDGAGARPGLESTDTLQPENGGQPGNAGQPDTGQPGTGGSPGTTGEGVGDDSNPED